ncbi:MAG: sulfatase-like hydrolase/transferase [Verrucomicrobia subdivision 3 bacterium]|nr:sulfatase-like hydrolase/transferase [Limisphaerales bacterium]
MQRLLSILLLTSYCALAVGEYRPPNIIVVLADDLGYGDLGCYGNKIVKTPHLDRFARQGMRFTDCYSAHPNCSPSRTGLMTGRTPTRVGVHNWIPMLSPMHVPASEITIASILQQGGYDTAHVGKWHLNGRFNLTGQPQPNDHGFNHWFSTQNNALPNHRNPWNFVRNGTPVGPLKGYAAGIVTDEAIHWLRAWRDKSKPFFLFVCYHEPHEPIASDPHFAKDYPSDDPSHTAYWANVAQLDASFGRLMTALDQQKLSDNTFVFFTSDNGPARTGFHPHGETAGLRDKKGSVYEGGIRVPGLVRWPGKVKAGAVESTPISGVDLLPTLCSFTGLKPPRDRHLDGANFRGLFRGETVQRTQPLYWHFYGARGDHQVALRDGDWKLIAAMDAPPIKHRAGITLEDQKTIKTAPLGKMELYNLKTDRAETTDLAKTEAGRFNRLSAQMKTIYAGVQKDTPEWPAWEFARYESQRIQWPPYRGAKKVPARKPLIPGDFRKNPLLNRP